VGWNARMDGIQGAVLEVKVKYLAAWNEARRRHARAYNEALAPITLLQIPREAPYGRHIYHVYALRAPRRDELIAFLGEKGISCGIHYPVPIHLQKAYEGLGLKPGDFPNAEKQCREFISLPMFPELATEQILYVTEEIKKFYT
jgi:dTDP-4-amino-4,6-dideoxygalactose transaminase